MVRLNFFVSFLACMSFCNTVFCSETIEMNQLEKSSKIVGSTSSKLFEDEHDFEDDELENVFVNSKAKKLFLVLQGFGHNDSDDSIAQDELDKDIFIDEDYFLVGHGCDIEYVVLDDARQFNVNNAHSDLGLACSNSEESFN